MFSLIASMMLLAPPPKAPPLFVEPVVIKFKISPFVERGVATVVPTVEQRNSFNEGPVHSPAPIGTFVPAGRSGITNCPT